MHPSDDTLLIASLKAQLRAADARHEVMLCVCYVLAVVSLAEAIFITVRAFTTP